jgi:hypothetical protein
MTFLPGSGSVFFDRVTITLGNGQVVAIYG